LRGYDENIDNPDESPTTMQASQTTPTASQEQNLSLADIKALSKAEVADDIIIRLYGLLCFGLFWGKKAA
jgi:hypothetical protein